MADFRETLAAKIAPHIPSPFALDAAFRETEDGAVFDPELEDVRQEWLDFVDAVIEIVNAGMTMAMKVNGPEIPPRAKDALTNAVRELMFDVPTLAQHGPRQIGVTVEFPEGNPSITGVIIT